LKRLTRRGHLLRQQRLRHRAAGEVQRRNWRQKARGSRPCPLRQNDPRNPRAKPRQRTQDRSTREPRCCGTASPCSASIVLRRKLLLQRQSELCLPRTNRHDGGQPRDIPGSDAILVRVMWSLTPPRITALHMLRSTMNTVSAPAISSFRGSNPTHRLCTLRVRRCHRPTQHSLPGGPLRPYLGLTCTG
jgi:hypothetical protein